MRKIKNKVMKKLLLALALMMPIFGFAQDVKIQDLNALGARIISASGYVYYLNNDNTSNTNEDIGLGSGVMLSGLNVMYDLDKPASKRYKLNFSFGLPRSYKDLILPAGARLLLKLKTGVNITLKNEDADRVRYDGSTWGYGLSCVYKITKAQLNQIIKSGGVTKLRFELGGGSLDVKLNDEFYKFIEEANKEINQTLAKKDTFSEGF